MNHPKAISGLLAVFFGMLSLPNNAQINLKTGYHISFLSDAVVDDLISEANRQSNYTHSFNELRWLHGFEAGLRYKGDVHAVELTYMSGYQQLRATRTSTIGGGDVMDKLKFGVQSAGVGYQISAGIFGLGADLSHQWYNTSAEFEEPDQRFKQIQKMWASQVYMMFIFEGSGNVSLVLKPFYIMPGKTYDPLPLASFLRADTNEHEHRWNRIGLSVIFYNGKS